MNSEEYEKGFNDGIAWQIGYAAGQAKAQQVNKDLKNASKTFEDATAADGFNTGFFDNLH